MEWIIKMNDAIKYIEENLTYHISISEVAEITGSSVYHFQRMFAVMTGVPISEYIRRRRMTLAVADLKAGTKIIDVALKYDYHSPTAFNRAFQSIHGVAPSLVRHDGVALKSYSPLTFQLVVQGVESLDYRIEEKPAFRVVGSSIELVGDMADMAEPMNQLWDVLEISGTIAQIKELSADKSDSLFEVMIPDDNTEEWRYLLGVPTTKFAPEKLEAYVVEAQTWAIFKDAGANMEEIQKDGGVAYRAIKEWLPMSGYEYTNGPDIQVYLKNDETGIELEFWLPVKKCK